MRTLEQARTHRTAALRGAAGAARLVAIAAALSAFSISGQAQSTSWIGGSSTKWTKGGNWTNGFPSSTTAIATFDSNFASGNSQPDLNSAESVGELDFASSLGQALTLSGSSTLSIYGSSGVGIDNASTQTVSLGVPVTLGAAQTWEGNGFTVSGAVANGGFALTVAPASGQTITLSGGLSGTGGLDADGAGTVSVTTANSYTGVTTLTSGILTTALLANGGSNSGLGASTNAASNLVFNGGTLQYTGAAVSANRLFTLGAGGGTINASGTGALTLSNTGSVAYSTANHAESLTLTGTSTAANTLAAVVGNNGTGITTLTKSGTGTWNLTAAETYTGLTTVSAGTLAFGVNNVVGTTNALTIASGATLDLGNFIQSVGTISGAGAIDFGTSTTLSQLTLNGSSTFSGSFAGTGTLIVGSGVTLTLGATFDDSGLNIELDGGTLDLSGNNGIFGDLIVAGASTINFNSASNSDIEFQNVSMMNGSASLAVTNWTYLSDYFYSVSQSQTPGTWNQPQLNQIAFTGDNSFQTVYDTNQANNTGPDAGVAQIRPIIPEPGSYGAIFAGLSLAGLALRRRLGALAVRQAPLG